MLVASLLILTMCVTLKVEGKKYDLSLSEKILGTSSKVCNTNSDVLRFAAMGHEAGLMDGVDSSVHMETKPSQYLSLKKTLLSVQTDLITGSDDEINLGFGMKWPEGTWSQPAYEEVTNFNYEGSTDIIYATVLQRVISNKEEQADSLNLKASISASYMGADVKASLSYAKEKKYAESNVLFEKASYLELCPQILDTCPTPREVAKNFLKNNGEKAFLDNFGTHFAIGFQTVVSGRYTNVVKSQTSEQKFKVAANLSAGFLGIGVGGGGGAYDGEKNSFSAQSTPEFTYTGTSAAGPSTANATEVFLWLDTELFNKEKYTKDRTNTIYFAHSACQWYQDVLLEFNNATTGLPDIPLPSDFLLNFGQEVRYFDTLLSVVNSVTCRETIMEDLYPGQFANFSAFYQNKSNLVSYYKALEATHSEIPFYENDYELESIEIANMVNKVQNLLTDVSNNYPLSCRLENVEPSESVGVMVEGYGDVSYIWENYYGDFLRYTLSPDIPQLLGPFYTTLCIYDGTNIDHYKEYVSKPESFAFGAGVQPGFLTNSTDCVSAYSDYYAIKLTSVYVRSS